MPLGEVAEIYVVRVRQGVVIRREVTVAAAAWVYTASLRAADALVGAYTVDVAQVSDRFGPGPFVGIAL